jgi:predicted oxidoreductase
MVKLVEVLDETAKRHSVSRTVMALAWLLKHPSGIIPIVGSSKPEHIRAALKADAVNLNREDWYRLYVAARGQKLP